LASHSRSRVVRILTCLSTIAPTRQANAYSQDAPSANTAQGSVLSIGSSGGPIGVRSSSSAVTFRVASKEALVKGAPGVLRSQKTVPLGTDQSLFCNNLSVATSSQEFRLIAGVFIVGCHSK
jgi:hypothetical protein